MNSPDDMQDIPLRLTLAEVNQVLEALGQRPYASVFQLIAKIQQQAEAHLHRPHNEAPLPEQEDSTPSDASHP